MAMGRSDGVQDELMATWAEMPRSPGHAFYDRLQDLLREASFDAFVEEVCKPYYAAKMGAPSLPPGRYFRMHMIGYFEGIDSERGIAWRCADSFSLRDFLRLSNRDKVPDHSWLSRTRSRLPHEAHEKVFGFVLKLVAERGLLKGERIGVDGSTMEATAALRTIVRRDNGETYRAMLTRMAKESGVDTPNAEDLARFDRKRKGKTLSNADWKSPTDPEAKIARMKDGTTHLASHGRVRVKRELWGNGRHLRQRLDHEASQRWSMRRRCVLAVKTASARQASRMRSTGEAGARVSARP
jgi:transposase